MRRARKTFKAILALLLTGVVVPTGSLAIFLLLTPQLDSAGHFLKERNNEKNSDVCDSPGAVFGIDWRMLGRSGCRWKEWKKRRA